MFGTDVLAADLRYCFKFPDFLALWNVKAKSVDFGSANWQNWVFFSPFIFWGQEEEKKKNTMT